MGYFKEQQIELIAEVQASFHKPLRVPIRAAKERRQSNLNTPQLDLFGTYDKLLSAAVASSPALSKPRNLDSLSAIAELVEKMRLAQEKLKNNGRRQSQDPHQLRLVS